MFSLFVSEPFCTKPVSSPRTHGPHSPLGRGIAGETQTALPILSSSSSDASVRWSRSAWISVCLSKWAKVTRAKCYQRSKILIIIRIKNPSGMSAKSRPCSWYGMSSKQMWREEKGGGIEKRPRITSDLVLPAHSRSWQTGGCIQANFWEIKWICVFAGRCSRKHLPASTAVSNVLPLDRLDLMCSCALTEWGANYCRKTRTANWVTSHGNYE